MPQLRKTATRGPRTVDPYVGALLEGITTGKTVLQLAKGLQESQLRGLQIWPFPFQAAQHRL